MTQGKKHQGVLSFELDPEVGPQALSESLQYRGRVAGYIWTIGGPNFRPTVLADPDSLESMQS